MKKVFDFSGWATRHNLKCSDGRTILKDAFKHNDGQKVPLVWNHQHNDSLNILGHALLENRPDGVYAYCVLNDTVSGKNAKLLVEHGDVSALSIYANGLKQQGSNVIHGAIREVSLVLAGANPGAFIDSVMAHGEESEEEAIIYTGENISLAHADNDTDDDSGEKRDDGAGESDKKTDVGDEKKDDKAPEALSHADKSESKSEAEETVGDVFNTLSDKQKNVVYAMISHALEETGADGGKSENNESNKEDDATMKHNIFDKEESKNEGLSHSDLEAIFSDAKRCGSLRDSVLSHGIENIDFLFPDAKNITNEPISIYREMGWVSKVMAGVHNTPFSRIKSILADLTEDEARAKGYIKGNMKVEEVFSLLKRITTPTTVYKKQKLDRDDIVDITDFDVVAWLKKEMRTMLDEEIARAVLVGDGRAGFSDDKINEGNIRPIWKDDDLFTIKRIIEFDASATFDQRARRFIREAIRARKDYKGSGNPTLYITEDALTDCLLIEDTNQRIIYDSVDKLATALRVKEIITVPVMEGLTREDGGDTLTLMGIVVNLTDYNVGADKGGAVNMFDDFDIDYNAQKYLIETRCSGALIKPFAAIAIESKTAAASG